MTCARNFIDSAEFVQSPNSSRPVAPESPHATSTSSAEEQSRRQKNGPCKPAGPM